MKQKSWQTTKKNKNRKVNNSTCVSWGTTLSKIDYWENSSFITRLNSSYGNMIMIKARSVNKGHTRIFLTQFIEINLTYFSHSKLFLVKLSLNLTLPYDWSCINRYTECIAPLSPNNSKLIYFCNTLSLANLVKALPFIFLKMTLGNLYTHTVLRGTMVQLSKNMSKKTIIKVIFRSIWRLI